MMTARAARLTSALVCLFAIALTPLAPLAAAGGGGDGADACGPPAPDTFTVSLPKLGLPPDEEGQNWDLPPVWDGHPGATSDAITLPNGRPIYALLISGYTNNSHLDELIFYDFARHLMGQGAYVHWAWWNNLLAPYMERPLHYNQSDPGGASDLLTFVTPAQAAAKAVPAEDYQFLADAKKMLTAIRQHNPDAMIIVAGHSMGGAAAIHLADQADVLIDIVAPIDPVGNRNYPWAGPGLYVNDNHFNWTRWRATRKNFLGYKSWEFIEWDLGIPPQPICGPIAQWLKNTNEAFDDVLCAGLPLIVHNAPAVKFNTNIINLYHRWQHEAPFPFDIDAAPTLSHMVPPGGTSSQSPLLLKASGPDPGGWPLINSGGDCCPSQPGVAWPADGHGEIVGLRGGDPKPLATRVRTSPRCDGCANLSWPARSLSGGTWSNGNGALRKSLLMQLEQLPPAQAWEHAPDNPGLCLVSDGLINLFNTMNKPPSADAGPDQLVEHSGAGDAVILLDASASSDSDNDALQYTWTAASGASASGEMAQMALPLGVHCIELEVKDPSGHVSRDTLAVTIADAATGLVPYASQASLWAAHHPGAEAYAFDEFYPGLADASVCLLDPPSQPGVLALAGGTVTLSASIADRPDCAIADTATPPQVSDGKISAGAVLTLDFDPPVAAFYSFYGSLSVGDTVTLTLYADPDVPATATLLSPPSAHNVQAAGHGFTVTTPIRRAEFATTSANTTLLGAFTSLLPGEPSLGTLDIPGYQGPDGPTIELDFACVFTNPCPADANADGVVDSADLNQVLADFGGPGTAGDVSGDGVVNSIDLNMVLADFGAGC